MFKKENKNTNNSAKIESLFFEVHFCNDKIINILKIALRFFFFVKYTMCNAKFFWLEVALVKFKLKHLLWRFDFSYIRLFFICLPKNIILGTEPPCTFPKFFFRKEPLWKQFFWTLYFAKTQNHIDLNI